MRIVAAATLNLQRYTLTEYRLAHSLRIGAYSYLFSDYSSPLPGGLASQLPALNPWFMYSPFLIHTVNSNEIKRVGLGQKPGLVQLTK